MYKAIIIAGLLTGCASTPPPRPIILTHGQFRCTVEPVVPAKDNLSDAAIAVYITRLQSAGEDCRKQLQEVKNVLEIQGATITDVLVMDVKPKKKRFGLF